VFVNAAGQLGTAVARQGGRSATAASMTGGAEARQLRDLAREVKAQASQLRQLRAQLAHH
jgi:hypothetical protein